MGKGVKLIFLQYKFEWHTQKIEIVQKMRNVSAAIINNDDSKNDALQPMYLCIGPGDSWPL
jgi:hypothetical protein